MIEANGDQMGRNIADAPQSARTPEDSTGCFETASTNPVFDQADWFAVSTVGLPRSKSARQSKGRGETARA
jgi:hypothetical protein